MHGKKHRRKSGRKKLKTMPETKNIDGMTMHLQSSFVNSNKAQAFAKRLRKQGYWARVIEVQRGRRKYHGVYVRSGRREEKQKERRERRSESYRKIGEFISHKN